MVENVNGGDAQVNKNAIMVLAAAPIAHTFKIDTNAARGHGSSAVDRHR